MMELDFSFEQSALEEAVNAVPAGGNLSAAQFLALTESETEEALQELLTELEIRHIGLDISGLLKYTGTGEAALRLRREEQLVKDGSLRTSLEENDPLRLFLEELDQLSGEADLQKMAAAYARGQDMLMEKLTNRMLPQVVEMAFGYVGRGVLLLDLIQEGSMGLWQGILSYTSGEFLPHAKWWIHQYLAKAVTMQAREAGFGQKMKQAIEDFRAVDERLLADLGRNPTLAEMADALHMSLEETEVVAKMLESARMLNMAKQANEPEEEEDPEQEQHVEDTALFQSRQRIADLMADLNEEDSKLLSLRFGLEGGIPLTAEETGRRLHMTTEEVVAREAAALETMRKQS